MTKELKELIKVLLCAGLVIIISVGLLSVPFQYFQEKGKMCQGKCEELNLTLKKVNYKGFFSQEVESCDCKIPDYIRVKVKR